MLQANIVHAEFFNGKRPESLEELFAEAKDRVKDCAPIKTHVRFFDESGLVTAFVLEAKVLQRKRWANSAKLKRARGLRRKWLIWQGNRMSNRHLQIIYGAAAVASEQLAIAVKLGRKVAIEDDYRGPLRLVRPEELHELVESCRKAYHAWIWVFAPNKLLADKNQTLGQIYLDS